MSSNLLKIIILQLLTVLQPRTRDSSVNRDLHFRDERNSDVWRRKQRPLYTTQGGLCTLMQHVHVSLCVNQVQLLVGKQIAHHAAVTLSPSVCLT